ncbi:MAG: hypothetical protein GF330_01080 [Candidatus Eisenbacteria bacterium]|nr:hypothetical protein [Candidatus Eisenbacteria bacterium]
MGAVALGSARRPRPRCGRRGLSCARDLGWLCRHRANAGRAALARHSRAPGGMCYTSLHECASAHHRVPRVHTGMRSTVRPQPGGIMSAAAPLLRLLPLATFALLLATVPLSAPHADWVEYSDALHYAGNVTGADTTWHALSQKDGIVYAAAGYDGLVIFDGTDPQHMVELSSYPLAVPVRDVAVRDDLAYLAADIFGVVILDVRDPSAPEFVGLMPVDRAVDCVALTEEMIVLGGDPNGIFFLDASDPQFPTLLYTLPTNGFVRDLKWDPASGYLYATDYADDLLVIDPRLSPPAILGTGPGPFSAACVAVHQDHVYVGTDCPVDEEIRVYDVSDPTDPQIVHTLPLDESCVGLEVVGGALFSAQLNRGLLIYNLYDPVEPRQIGWIGTVYQACDVAVWEAGEMAYFGGAGSPPPTSTLEAAALTTFDHLRPQRELPIEGIYALEVGAGYAYTAQDFLDLVVVDIESWQIVGTEPLASIPFQMTLQPERELLHVALGFEGYAAIGLRDPSAPTTLASLPLIDETFTTDAEGTLLATANRVCFHLIDTSDPEDPQVLSQFHYDDQHVITRVKIRGDLLYAGGATYAYQPFVWIVDISDPEHPVSLCMYDLPTEEWQLWLDVEGDYAYISGYFRLHIVDVSNPEAPTVVSETRLPLGGTTEHRRITVAERVAYLSNQDVGCIVLDCADPTDPCFVGYLRPALWTFDAALWEDHLYLNAGGLGLFEFDRHEGVSSSAPAGGWTGLRALELGAAPTLVHAGTTLHYATPRAGELRLGIYDVGGRCVRILANGPQPPGPQTIAWDGRDGRGRRVAAGSYWARLQTAEGSRARPIVVLR